MISRDEFWRIIARYGVYEDAVLFTTGIYSLILLLKGDHE